MTLRVRWSWRWSLGLTTRGFTRHSALQARLGPLRLELVPRRMVPLLRRRKNPPPNLA